MAYYCGTQDALQILLPLLSSSDTACNQTLEILGREANAKEVLLAVQEVLEGWVTQFSYPNDEDEGDNDSKEEEKEISSGSGKFLSFAQIDKLLQLVTLGACVGLFK